MHACRLGSPLRGAGPRCACARGRDTGWQGADDVRGPTRRQTDTLAARVIPEEKNLEALVGEILEAAARTPQ